MSTGDIKNNLRKLQAALKLINYEKDSDFDSLARGKPDAFLTIYHYVFLSYSHPVSSAISQNAIEMSGKTDTRFLECLYRVLRDMFDYKPLLTLSQFFSNSFGERKVIMCTDVINLIYKKHKALSKKTNATVQSHRLSSAKATSLNTNKNKATVESHSGKEGNAQAASKEKGTSAKSKRKPVQSQSASRGQESIGDNPVQREPIAVAEPAPLQLMTHTLPRPAYNSQAYMDTRLNSRDDGLADLRRVSTDEASVPPLVEQHVDIQGAPNLDVRVERHIPVPAEIPGMLDVSSSSSSPLASPPQVSVKLDNSNRRSNERNSGTEDRMAFVLGELQKISTLNETMLGMQERLAVVETELQRINILNERMLSMEERTTVVETLVSSSYQQKDQQQAQPWDQALRMIENLNAKVTLLNHRVMVVEKGIGDVKQKGVHKSVAFNHTGCGTVTDLTKNPNSTQTVESVVLSPTEAEPNVTVSSRTYVTTNEDTVSTIVNTTTPPKARIDALGHHYSSNDQPTKGIDLQV